MFHMPRIFILHQRPLPLPQHLQTQRRDIRFVSEFLDGREQRFEIEDDGTGEGEAAQGLPVDAQVDAGEGERGELVGAVEFVGVAGGHEEGGVDFETPGAALDGAVGGEAGEVAVGGRGVSLGLVMDGWRGV